MTETITITGLKEVQKKLYSYSQQLGDRVVFGALRQGANLMRKKMSGSAPMGSRPHWVGLKKNGIWVRPGHLRKKGFKIFKSRIHSGKFSGGMIGLFLALRKGKKAPFYGRFISYGWNSHGKRVGWSKARPFAVTRRSGRVTTPGRNIPGADFIRRAFEANKEQSARLIIRSAEAGASLLARKIGL